MLGAFLKQLWIDKLPTSITQLFVTMTDVTAIEKLIDIADKILTSISKYNLFQRKKISNFKKAITDL